MTPAFQIDTAELNRLARERWGIRMPIRVRVARELPSVGLLVPRIPFGNIADPHAHFELTVERDLDTQTLLETLAHELEHAAQGTRMGILTFFSLDFRSTAWCLYDPDVAGWEAGARRAEARWTELLSCRKPRRKEPNEPLHQKSP